MTKKALISPAFEKCHFSYYITPSFRPQKARYASRFTRYELCSLYKQIMPRLKNSAISAFSAVKTSCLSVFVAINPFNQRNPRLINDLRLRKFTYEKINLFLQNEPNSCPPSVWRVRSQMNVSNVLTMYYEQMDTWSIRKNEPKRTQF
jgi:hypothetical protein